MINDDGKKVNVGRNTLSDRFDEISPWVDQKQEDFNGSDKLSDYSSCEESEFGRYCSANSVMGTASLCSSVGTCNDFLDLDFGSLSMKISGFETSSSNRGSVRVSGDKSVSTSREFDYSIDRSEFHNEDFDTADGDFREERSRKMSRIRNWSKSLPTSEENSSLSGAMHSESRDGTSISTTGEKGLESSRCSNIKTNTNYDNENKSSGLSRVPRGSEFLATFSEDHNPQVVCSKHNEGDSVRMETQFDHLSSSSEFQMGTGECENSFSERVSNAFDLFDGKESGRPEEEGTSSTYEHSDDDGSMFNYGSDGECRMDSYDMTNLHYLQESQTKNINENPLLIGSSVAFGANDWDDFMQESEENNLDTMLLDKLKDQQENIETTGKVVDSVSMVPLCAPNKQDGIVRNVTVTTCLANGKVDPENCSTRDSLSQQKSSFAAKASLKIDLNVKDRPEERGIWHINNNKVIGLDTGSGPEIIFMGNSKQSDLTVYRLSSSLNRDLPGKEAMQFEDSEGCELLPAVVGDLNKMTKTNHSSASVGQSEELLAPIKVGNLEPKESYDEVVLDMEEILLESMEIHGARFSQNNRSFQPFRDGSSTASTSGTDDAYPLKQHSLKIDGIEVVGAKQKKGDVSLGERLVGVKEYTVYLLRVWSGKDQWQVERRYRDFFTLYRQLKTLYGNHGWSLPTPWSSVEQESRKFFGNASPNVVSERSTLIQECLRSILHSETPNGAPGTLNWFLSPQKAVSSSSLLKTLVPQSTSAFMGGASTEAVPTFGKTISLLVEIQPRKSVKQLLEVQHNVCAGCHKCLDAEKSLMREFVLSLGWGKPRLCEYTGQLFCASCHTNETAVLPARVLHFWDFTQYPVSQMAKSYLDSIYDQPMLCVSAVNPFLFSKVPALLHVMGIRKKIGAMMPYVRCPFRRSIQRGVGSRRYLLESNEFFALRDLVDLSKGAFSALPVMVKAVSTKILDHITQQCLICCDVGIPCGARQACEDPSSLIFPFQEDEVKRCKSCELVFHKPCFIILSKCPCSVGSEVGKGAVPAHDVKHEPSNNEALVSMARNPDSGYPMKFLSSLFSTKRQEKALGRKNSNPVILMGSLPSTFSDPL
ncbi:Differentially expressed in fdcp 8-like protein [Thalictrum thalictroides]|uniref:Differentially expressed in fdcp 8-like protein n=1 Tax=Thalictrum thalictroides TaxID=46969 RepID=A0A7J6WRQ4_THATH|nr:Differentially expressed in fdcp 8-like protein [Thalictrum thalictroides]